MVPAELEELGLVGAALIMVGCFDFVFWLRGKEGDYGRVELWSSVLRSGWMTLCCSLAPSGGSPAPRVPVPQGPGGCAAICSGEEGASQACSRR